MIRHPMNHNLMMHYEPFYAGLPVQTAAGPLCIDYLYRTLGVIESALTEYPRVFAFRLDLRFPLVGIPIPMDGNRVIERFFASLKAKLRHNRLKAKEIRAFVPDTSVRYVWCRECGHHGVPHYHVAILLNQDAFFKLGKFELGRSNLYNRLIEAWASALGLAVESVSGLVEFPENGCYYLRRDDPSSVVDFFHRVSYLCKAATKVFEGQGIHSFGASRL